MTIDSLRNVKDRFSEFVNRVDREHERIVVTRNRISAAGCRSGWVSLDVVVRRHGVIDTERLVERARADTGLLCWLRRPTANATSLI